LKSDIRSQSWVASKIENRNESTSDTMLAGGKHSVSKLSCWLT